MTYLCFQLKRLLKSRLTYVPLLLIVAASLVTLFLNAKANQNNNLGVQISESLQQTQKAVADEKERLKTLSKDSAEYPYVQKNISGGEATIKSDRAFLAAYQKGDWKTVYQKQIAYLEKVRQTAKENTIDATMKSVLNRDLLMYQALAKENFAYEDPYFPTQALPFVLSLTNYLFPALLPIALIFILSDLYTSAFASKTIDKTRLLPERAWCLALKDITVGFVVSLALLILSVLPVFLVAAIFFGVGEWDYPILHYHLSDKTLYFSPIKDSVLPSLLLQVLSLLVMSVAIYLIAQLVKNKVATLFVALVVLLGAVVLPLVVVPLAPYVQWLPTGYIKSFEVATGLLQHQLDNWQMSATQGYGVLITWLLGLTLLSLLWKSFSARKVQLSIA